MRRVLVIVLTTVLALGGYLALDIYDRVPGVLTLAPAASPPPARQAVSSSVTPVDQPRPQPAGMPLAASGGQAPVPTTLGLQRAVGPVIAEPALGPGVSVAIRDGLTGAHLLDVDPDRPRTPASSVKLLSALAIRTAFPPGATLTTTVVRGAASDQVVLVAGGDTMLSPGRGDPQAVSGRAGLDDLAAATASSLQAQGVTAVGLALDLRYAPGPASPPTWSPEFLRTGMTGAVAMLGLSTQRATPGHPGPANPPVQAAQALVARLKEHGVTARLDPAPGAAPAGASVLGSVSSAPVADQLALALEESDNALTESLTRQASYLQGAGTSFAETAAFVRRTVEARGVDVFGLSTVDTCGLSTQDAVPARTLADVIALGVSNAVPGMRETLARLPVAGLEGTLSDRFGQPSTHIAAGVVRAKTGTLTGVNTMAGTVVTAEGRLLTFAVLAQGAPTGPGTLAARASLDRFVAALATCGCR